MVLIWYGNHSVPQYDVGTKRAFAKLIHSFALGRWSCGVVRTNGLLTCPVMSELDFGSTVTDVGA